MVNISVLSVNIRGLNSAIKRTKFLDSLRRHCVDVALVQESHLKSTDVPRMQNKYYKVVASCSDGTKTKGSLILIKRSLPLVIKKCSNDKSGRLSYFCTNIQGKEIAFVSVYAPAVFDVNFFQWLTNQLLILSDYALIIGGDMNALADLMLDKSTTIFTKSQEITSTNFKSFLETFNLIDVWRVQNPSIRDYTFFSARHQTYSRIDYILCSREFRMCFEGVTILPAVISDHNPLLTKFSYCSHDRSPRWQFNTTLLQDSGFLMDFRNKLKEFLNINLNSVDNHMMVWMATKGFIRDFVISFSSHLNKVRKAQIEELEQICLSKETELKKKFSKSVESALKSSRSKLNDLLRRKAEFIMHRVRQNYYFNGPRPSKLLALQLRQSEARAIIDTIDSPTKGLVTNPREINKTFVEHFKDLYQPKDSADMVECYKFLQDLDLPQLTQSEAQQMSQPITLVELYAALKTAKKGKSPGPDGIPPEIILHFWDILGPIMHAAINMAIQNGHFEKQMNTALISLIPKKGKDHTKCFNFRPISLINSDLKVYARVLAIRLEKYIGKLVHSDQSGFIPHRSAADNIRRLLHIINESKDKKSPYAVLSLDADKAFDRLNWDYLWEVLDKFGFDKKFINMVQIIYNNPSASIATNGLHSQPFDILRGTRQGCPLSPMLFALSLEPLAQKIRQDQICSISIKGTQHAISLYADDILLYFSDFGTIQNILEIFNCFGKFSGYRINWSKSSLLPLNKKAQSMQITTDIPITNQITYLGILIQSDLKEIVHINYDKVFQKLKTDIDRWRTLPASLQSRVSTVKMNILPRVNFLSAMIPLPPSSKWWKNLDSLIRTFLWNGKQPKLKLATLQRTKMEGGLSLPNFELYHKAFQLRAVKTWFNTMIPTPCREIEEAIVKPIRLEDVLFSGLSLKYCKQSFGPIITNTINTFKTVEKLLSYDNKWHLQTPLWRNRNIKCGSEPFTSEQWSKQGIRTLADIWDDNGMLSFQNIAVSFNVPASSFFLFLQLRSALRAYGVPWGLALETHPVHSWFFNFSQQNVVSAIYSRLLEVKVKQLPLHTIWVRELSVDQIDWETVWGNIFGASKNPNHQLIHYKFCHRLYWTPKKRFLVKLSLSPHCNFCTYQQVGTFMHMVWECEKVYEFWERISSILSDMIGKDIPVQPVVLLLNDDSSLGFTELQRKIWLAGLTSAKKIIAQRWLPPHTLSVRHWLLQFHEIVMLELSTARINKARASTIEAWKVVAKDLTEKLQV